MLQKSLSILSKTRTLSCPNKKGREVFVEVLQASDKIK